MNDRERATVLQNLNRLADFGYHVATYCHGCGSASIVAQGEGMRVIAVHRRTLIEASFEAVAIAEAAEK